MKEIICIENITKQLAKDIDKCNNTNRNNVRKSLVTCVSQLTGGVLLKIL